ncbi:hypothetical protein AB0B94_30770 [Micromonospora sp. NPDC048986]|uniref:hypothetical protein n=1 Tax=Micromonospora sp. NPDC048986 TaxID=3155644 RepID=UPI003403C420
MSELPILPPGTVLRLAPGEWCGEDRVPVWDRAYICVERVHADSPEQAWVTGHAIECAYKSSDCTIPCMVLLVRVAAILRQVER